MCVYPEETERQMHMEVLWDSRAQILQLAWFTLEILRSLKQAGTFFTWRPVSAWRSWGPPEPVASAVEVHTLWAQCHEQYLSATGPASLISSMGGRGHVGVRAMAAVWGASIFLGARVCRRW